jgi:hypothetical protein
LDQKRSTTITLHWNQAKGRLGLMMLDPARAAATEITEPVKDNHSCLRFDLERLHERARCFG